MWWAAEKAWPGRVFRDYALLGDDIVIGCPLVADVYLKILEQLQVKVSKAKSVSSSSGALEFAKKFWVKSVSVDLSPLSLRSLLASHLPLSRYALARNGMKKILHAKRIQPQTSFFGQTTDKTLRSSIPKGHLADDKSKEKVK